ncbi:MAG: nucleotidyltransferase family protein [Betaproteobacteria bacterium]|nr:nucleotidyltransferase family protein [Betaproteobacteria bacterium]
MPAMLLAAGRGERMRPLTDRCPKPLQTVRGRPLIDWQLQRLAAAGVRDVVVNHAWLGEQIEAFVGDGGRWGLSVRWSREGTALGTAGGVASALPLLQSPLLLVVSADLYTDYDYARLLRRAADLEARTDTDAHLVLVADPAFPRDFSLQDGRVVPPGQNAGTYGNMGVYRRAFFETLAPGHAAELGPLLRAAVAAGRVSGEWFDGAWANVGTAADLDRLNGAGEAG